MKIINRYIKYLFIVPLIMVQFSCDEAATESVVYNGDVVGSWKLTGLTGVYTYTVSLPAGTGSGLEWPAAADTSFGVKIRWDQAATVLGADSGNAEFWVPGAQFSSGDVALLTEAVYTEEAMVAADFGLIGVFEDAPSANADATYLMKGTYPGIFYNYSQCASAGSTAPMTDQGLYTADLTATSNNFTIKRDPNISGSQVLPPFDDGALTLDSTGNTLNIKFLDRDSHSTRYSEVMSSWDEGNHPSSTLGGNNENSGGDRTYMAFPPLTVDANNAFAGSYDGTEGTSPASSGYYMDPTTLSAWGNYMTYNALNFLGCVTTVSAANGGDSDAATATCAQDANYQPFLVDDSSGDFSLACLADADPSDCSGKLTFDVIRDCAVPVDVTIDFDATFTRCTSDNCVDDGYHVAPTWE